MARPLRLEFAHALYHVTSRGDRREDIYHDDADRQAWLTVLAQVCKRFNWTVHAYCLMSNHYHLLVETPDANLSAGMRQLNGVYTQLTNRAHDRVGHVFQGRFKAIVVDKDSYLLELARYVVLNPVRAGMVDDPGQWPWSSYGAMLAPGRLPGSDWLATDKLLAYFAPEQPLLDREKAQQRYVDHVREGIGLPSVWEDLSGQMYLGDEKFVAKMSDMAEQIPQGARAGRSRLEIPHAQRRPVPLPLQSYIEQYPNNRNAAIQAAFASGNYTMAQLAEHFKLHYTSVSRIVKLV
jgi:REP element-mobilizing transposase RayT